MEVYSIILFLDSFTKYAGILANAAAVMHVWMDVFYSLEFVCVCVWMEFDISLLVVSVLAPINLSFNLLILNEGSV